MLFSHNTSLIYERRKGTEDDSFINITESRKLTENIVLLSEIPSIQHHVTVTEIPTGIQYYYYEVFDDSELADNQFRVDYNYGFVYFSTSNISKELTFTYKGTGCIFTPVNRIWTKLDSNGNIIETLDEIIDAGAIAIEALQLLNQIIQDAETATTNAITATTNAINAMNASNEAESLRVTAEQNRVIAENNRITETNLAIHNAEVATTNAIEATEDANIATENANNCRYLGEYNPSTTYKINNIVKYDNALYICKANSTGNLPTNITYFDISNKPIVWRNEYNPAITYSPLDAVSYLGSSYICKQNSTGNIPTNNTYFNPLALKGEKGASLSPRGAYSNVETYSKDDLVFYTNGSISGVFYAKQTTLGNLPTNTTYWDTFLVGGGNMNSDVYDTNGDGIVNSADTLNGLTASVAELNYVDGVTSPIQTQINNVTNEINLLSDKINNPTYLDPVDIYSVGSIPNTAVQAPLADGKVEGRVLKNELNYNRDTWAEWTKDSGVVGNSTGLEFTANGVKYRTANLNTNIKQNTKYGFLYYVVNSTLSGRLVLTGDRAFQYQGCPKTVGNQKLVVTSNATITTNQTGFQIELNTEPAGNKIKLKDIRVFELPTGSQIETDFTMLTADALALKYPYVAGDSLINTEPQELVFTGVNIFDANSAKVINSLYPSTNAFEAAASGTKTLYIPCARNTDYTVSKIISKRFTVCFSKEVPQAGVAHYYLSSNSAVTQITRNSGDNNYLCVYFMHPDDTLSQQEILNSIQIEKGTSATPYSSYKETVIQSPTLRAVSETIKDIFHLNEGKCVRNVKRYVLQASDIAQLITTSANFDRVTIPISTLSGIANYVGTTYNGKTLIKGYPEKTFEDSVANVNTHFLSSTTGLNIIFDKGLYANLAAAQAALAGTVIQYQLATPIVEYYPTKQVVAIPNGMVYTNPKCVDVGLYSTKITVEQTAYPIKTLKYVNKIDVKTGVLTPIDLTKCTVASDGLSFTIVGALIGDYYDYGWYYNTAKSTVPKVTLTCASNLKSAVNETVNATKKLGDAVDRVDSQVSGLAERTEKLAYLNNTIFTTTGLANTYSVAIDGITALSQLTGIPIKVKLNADMSGASTLNVNTLGAIAWKKSNGSNFVTGKNGGIYTVVFDGVSAFILQGEGGEIPKLPNLIKNGNFANSGNCFTWANLSTISFVSDEVLFTASAQYGCVNQTHVPYKPNHKYYARAYVYGDSYAQLYASDNTTWTYAAAHSATTQYEYISFEFTPASVVASPVFWVFGVRSKKPSAWTQIKATKLMLFDCTEAFGVGNEPTKEEMDAMVVKYGNWWDSDLAQLTDDATGVESDILSGKIVYADGKRIVGSMPNNPSQTATLEINNSGKPTKAVPAGYTSGGTITAQLASSLASKIVAGEVIGGVTGTNTNKRWANGQVTTSNGVNTVISGLGFTPTQVFVWVQRDSVYFTVHIKSTSGQTLDKNINYWSDSSAGVYNNSQITITSDGFSVYHGGYTSAIATWFAYE